MNFVHYCRGSKCCRHAVVQLPKILLSLHKILRCIHLNTHLASVCIFVSNVGLFVVSSLLVFPYYNIANIYWGINKASFHCSQEILEASTTNAQGSTSLFGWWGGQNYMDIVPDFPFEYLETIPPNILTWVVKENISGAISWRFELGKLSRWVLVTFDLIPGSQDPIYNSAMPRVYCAGHSPSSISPQIRWWNMTCAGQGLWG